MSAIGVSSRTFSIRDLEGSVGGGLIRVPVVDCTIAEVVGGQLRTMWRIRREGEW